MKNSNSSSAQEKNLDDLFSTLGINSSSTPFPNASNMVSNNTGDTAFSQKDIRGGDNSYLSGGGVGSNYFDGLRNYMTDNRPGSGMSGAGGMRDLQANRGSGGTGGGSEDTVGNMDANALLELNPYLSKNVTSFGHGGMFGEFAKYSHGGTVGSMAYVDQGVIPQGNTTFNPYTGEYSRAVKQRYDNGGMMPQQGMPQQMPQQTESYAKQANDMIALAQLEEFGKAYAAKTPLENMPLEVQQGLMSQMPQAKHGMRMPKYAQGGMHRMPDGSMMLNSEMKYNQGGGYKKVMKRFTKGGRF